MATWIPIDDACRQLGVRPQTVYAYVSRRKLEAMPDPADPRRSLVRAEDVATLSKRKQDGRKHETLAANTLFGAEPSIPTSISTFVRGRLLLRGQDAVTLARTATLEDMARLLWDAERPVHFPPPGGAAPKLPGRAAVFALLGTLAAHGHSTHGRVTRVLHDEARALVGQVATAFGAARTSGEPLHLRYARSWGQDGTVAALLRTAMALLAEHELTASAFSTRIAASTGASLPACLLAGLTTFSGPLHGDASGRVRALLDEVALHGGHKVLDRHLQAALPIAGFGHPLYPDGDPRAASLLALFEPPEPIARFIEQVTALTGLLPTIDMALAALVARHGLPDDAAFALFATARSVGLLAHALEQRQVGQMIRPRGRYVGPLPEAAPATRTPR